MKRKTNRIRLKYDRIILFLVVLIVLVIGIKMIFRDKNHYMLNVVNVDVDKAREELKKYNMDINVTYKYDDKVSKDRIISQSVKEGEIITSDMKLSLVVSKGKINLENVPIMMYHGIIDKKDSETDYIGGNVDKDGYNRTVESFKRDLEFYYSNGYRMIKLSDYINGNIYVEYGYSPIILTFDDGNPNNMKVLGKDDKGELIIDENCAVGIMESFKKKYPDYNVTATFFVNDYLFQQSKYDEDILKWLVKHDYTIGNHTKGHANFSKIDTNKTQEVVGFVYQKLESILGTDYLHIVALPFGSPYSKTHANYPYILKGSYEGKEYETEAALRVGWEPELSPYHKDFDKTFLKRCRAYDNNGVDFDIEMVFRILDKKRYISDGNVKTIVTSNNNSDIISNNLDKEIILYE